MIKLEQRSNRAGRTKRAGGEGDIILANIQGKKKSEGQ